MVGKCEQREIYKRYKLVGYGPHSVLETSGVIYRINPFKPEFTMVIFIHYKPRIAVAILDL